MLDSLCYLTKFRFYRLVILTVITYRGNVAELIVLLVNVTLIVVVLVTAQTGVFLNPVTPAHEIVPIEGKVIPEEEGNIKLIVDVSPITEVKVRVKE